MTYLKNYSSMNSLKMRVLVISKVSWRNDLSGGYVMSNMFSDFDAEFAMIYCSDIDPNNNICKRYYQVTDKMMVNHILHGGKIGRRIDYQDYPSYPYKEGCYDSKKSFIPGNVLRMMRELVWKFARWDKRDLIQFIDDFSPDIIYAPCQGAHYMIRLVKFVAEYTNAPVVSYISDDFYTNNQYSFSPVFWINHFILRRNVRDIFKHYSLCYTMTDEQKNQCERDFGVRMKVLRNRNVFPDEKLKKHVGSPIQLVFGGNLIYNRYKTLELLIEEIKKINSSEIKMVLNIYSNTKLQSDDLDLLNDGINSHFNGPVSKTELDNIYSHSDIALHVEGFDSKSRHMVRMSFSTKIIDCLASGCAVLAICDPKQAGGAYLRRNDAAICINSKNEINPMLNAIVSNPQMIIDYQHKAFELGRRCHSMDDNNQNVISDFRDLIVK